MRAGTWCYRAIVELRHLRYFVAVADELHFGRAAERLHIVQPALSKQISALEKDLGVQLFERTKRRVCLTEAGAIFLEEAREVLAQAGLAAERARSAARGQRGVLTIGFITPALISVLPPALRAYRQRYPDVRLVLRESPNRPAVQGVLDNQFHLAFIRLPIEDTSLCCETVLEEPVVLAVPDDHELAEMEEIPLAALADEPFVMIPRSQEPVLYDYNVAMCLDAGFSPRIVHEANTTLVAVGLVAGGIGIAFVPASTQQIVRPGLVYRRIRQPTPLFRLGVVWQPDPSPVVKAFLDTRPWKTDLPARLSARRVAEM
ncbi:MAG: LysR family transcriptional regulator [Streptosporangiales bacterium]|nr:LysR family transcriptional regulator [Streptosporangiales bacterium]